MSCSIKNLVIKDSGVEVDLYDNGEITIDITCKDDDYEASLTNEQTRELYNSLKELYEGE